MRHKTLQELGADEDGVFASEEILSLINELQSDFENKGKYIVWDKSWNRVGYADAPQHSGQVPIRFPEHWPPFMCFKLGDHANV